MKQFFVIVVAFGLGVIVGTAGSDDSLLKEAVERESTAYERGSRDAVEKFQAVAQQMGFARWEFDPHTGRQSNFVWAVPPEFGDALLEDLTPAVAWSDRLDEPGG